MLQTHTQCLIADDNWAMHDAQKSPQEQRKCFYQKQSLLYKAHFKQYLYVKNEVNQTVHQLLSIP